MQNKSLVVSGKIRAIQEVPQMVRMLEVKLEEELEEKASRQTGWQMERGAWIGVHLSKHYQDPQFVVCIDQVTYMPAHTQNYDQVSVAMPRACSHIYGAKFFWWRMTFN